MLPTLIQLGPLTLSSLGFLTALGYFFATFLIWKKEKEENFDEETIMDAIIMVTITAFLGSRILYVASNWVEIDRNLFSIFNFVGKPGYSFQGGLIAGIFGLSLFCNKRKLDFYKIGDFSTFGLAILGIFVYIGQFLDGSNFGTVTSLPWALKFPGVDGLRHPTQIYELMLMFIIFRLLYYFDKNFRTFDWYRNKRGEAEPGFLFLVFIILLTLEKFGVAFLKEHGLYWLEFQLTNLAVILIAVSILIGRTGKRLTELIPIFKNLAQRRSKFHLKSGTEAK